MGTVTGVRPERFEEYKTLHANPPESVLQALRDAHIQNYSIYCHGDLLFGYFEYTGEDFKADMEMMTTDSATREW